MQTPNLFSQPDPVHPSLRRGSSRARERSLDEKKRRLGPPSGRRSIDERFQDFHRQNPHVFDILVEQSLRIKREAGVDHYGLQAIYEAVRFDRMVKTKGKDSFKLNNDFVSRYARVIMDSVPELEGFFETRAIRS